MTTPLPATVQSMLGEPAASDLARWLEQTMSEGRIPPREWDETRGRMDRYEQDVGELKDGMGVLRADVDVLKTDVAVLKTDVAVLKTDVAVLKTDVAGLKSDVSDLRTEMNTRFDRMSEQFNTRFDALQAMFAERMDRQEERMARQTRWAIGMLGLVSTTVTLLLAIQALGLAG